MKGTFPKAEIAEKLRTYRTLHGLTQTELSLKLGVSFRAVVSWEQGWRRPDLFSIIRLAEVTGIPMEQWLEGIPPCYLPHGSGPRHRTFRP